MSASQRQARRRQDRPRHLTSSYIFWRKTGHGAYPVFVVEDRIDSQRRLPHWVPEAVPVFVTWRLADTLPRVLESRKKQAGAGERFVSADSELDQASYGPVWLADHRVADMIIEALHYGERVRNFYELHAYVVMPNHVHVVWEPRISLPRILQWLKGVGETRQRFIRPGRQSVLAG